MTFPVVAATNTSATVNSTTHTVALPASISAGDLLLILLTCSQDATWSTPTDWTQLFQVANGANRKSACFYKIADGGEGASVDVTSSSAIWDGHESYRITGYSGTPEAATATGSDTTPDPPSLSPSWGSADTLWLAAAFAADAIPSNITLPASYTDLLLSQDAVGSTLVTGRRENATATENPGTFANGNNAPWVAATIAVQPGGGLVPDSKMHQMAGGMGGMTGGMQ